MNPIRTAIYTKFTEITGGVHNSLYSSVNGAMYYDHAPQGTAYPYIAFYLLDDASEWTFREKFEYVSLQFNIFIQGSYPTQAETIYANLIALYDDARLSVTGYSAISCVRQFASGPMWFQEEGVWQITVRYIIMLQDT